MTSTVETAIDIRPFHIDIPDEALEDVRGRIAAWDYSSDRLRVMGRPLGARRSMLV